MPARPPSPALASLLPAVPEVPPLSGVPKLPPLPAVLSMAVQSGAVSEVQLQTASAAPRTPLQQTARRFKRRARRREVGRRIAAVVISAGTGLRKERAGDSVVTCVVRDGRPRILQLPDRISNSVNRKSEGELGAVWSPSRHAIDLILLILSRPPADPVGYLSATSGPASMCRG